jgi:hypothetical protein
LAKNRYDHELGRKKLCRNPYSDPEKLVIYDVPIVSNSIFVAMYNVPSVSAALFVAIYGVPIVSIAFLSLYTVFPAVSAAFLLLYILCSHCLSCIFVAIYGVAFLSRYTERRNETAIVRHTSVFVRAVLAHTDVFQARAGGTPRKP